MRDQLRVDDVVHDGVGGAFDKKLGRVTKVNTSKPVLEDGAGCRGCYWKANLSRVGRVDSRFGFCSLCNRPSEFAKPCPRSGTGGLHCSGVIAGDYNWKLIKNFSPRLDPPMDIAGDCMATFLAKQLGAALFRLGLVEITDEILDAVLQGFRDSASSPGDLRAEPPPVPISVASSSP
jgi:hypothetical protein